MRSFRGGGGGHLAGILPDACPRRVGIQPGIGWTKSQSPRYSPDQGGRGYNWLVHKHIIYCVRMDGRTEWSGHYACFKLLTPFSTQVLLNDNKMHPWQIF